MIYDVIIVLAGGIKDNGELPENMKKRVEKAKELYDAKYAKRIIMSGKWSRFRDSIPPKTEAEAMVSYGLQIGIPKDVLLKEEYSDSTASNAHYLLKLFLIPHKWQNLIIVTSDYHMDRVQYMFKKLFDSSYNLLFISAKSYFSPRQRIICYVKEKILLLLNKIHIL